MAARLRAPPRQQRRTGRAGAKGTSWRLRFLPCPSAPTALLCVSRTEAARRGRAAHVAQNGGRGERGGPPRPGPAHPLPGVAVPGADDGSRLLDHLQHGAAVHVARDVGVVGAHDPAEAALSRGGVPPRHAAPRRAAPCRMPETSARGERFLPVTVVTARYPPRSGRPPHGAAPRSHPGGSAVRPGTNSIPAPSRPLRSAPPRPAPAALPEGGSRAPAPGGRRHRTPSGTGRGGVTWRPGWWPGPGPPRPAPTWRHRRPPATALRRRRH